MYVKIIAAEDMPVRSVPVFSMRAKKRGASHAYLQVVKNNTSAEKLYSSLGFQYSYTYWFRVQPVGTRFQ